MGEGHWQWVNLKCVVYTPWLLICNYIYAKGIVIVIVKEITRPIDAYNERH